MDKIKLKPIPATGIKCHKCHMKMFACETPSGGDYTTCPICDNIGGNIDFILDKDTGKKIIISEDDYYLDGYRDHYCDRCHTLYDLGCRHCESGCTDDIYHGMLVSSIKCGDKQYDGMPIFESIDHCRQVLPNFVLNWYCTCQNNQYDCTKAHYFRKVEHNCRNK